MRNTILLYLTYASCRVDNNYSNLPDFTLLPLSPVCCCGVGDTPVEIGVCFIVCIAVCMEPIVTLLAELGPATVLCVADPDPATVLLVGFWVTLTVCDNG